MQMSCERSEAIQPLEIASGFALAMPSQW